MKLWLAYIIALWISVLFLFFRNFFIQLLPLSIQTMTGLLTVIWIAVVAAIIAIARQQSKR